MVMQSRGSLLTIFVFAAMLISISTVNAAEVKVMASNALKELLLELVPAFEKASGNKVTLIWGGTEGLSKKVLDGEIADVVILARSNIDKLIQDGKLATGSRTDLVKSSIGIAVRSGLPKPDVSSTDAVKKAVLAARSVGYPN
jgi:molybdate transport system substrate-binding protein